MAKTDVGGVQVVAVHGPSSLHAQAMQQATGANASVFGTYALSDAINVCRVKQSLTTRDLAQRVKASAKDVDSWERGEAVPSPAQFSALKATFPWLAGMVGSSGAGLVLVPPPPMPKPKAPAVVAGIKPKEASAPKESPALTKQSESPSTPLSTHASETFGVSLRRIKHAAKVSTAWLAEQIGVSPTAILHWERNIAVPVEENYQKLLKALPAMSAVPKPVLQAIEVPVGNLYGSPGSHVSRGDFDRVVTERNALAEENARLRQRIVELCGQKEEAEVTKTEIELRVLSLQETVERLSTPPAVPEGHTYVEGHPRKLPTAESPPKVEREAATLWARAIMRVVRLKVDSTVIDLLDAAELCGFSVPEIRSAVTEAST